MGPDVGPVGPTLVAVSPVALMVGAVAGGVVVYRRSAKPPAPEGVSGGPQIRPVVAPSQRAETGVIGVSVMD